MARTGLKLAVGLIVALGLSGTGPTAYAEQNQGLEVVEWNQIFIDTLIARL